MGLRIAQLTAAGMTVGTLVLAALAAVDASGGLTAQAAADATSVHFTAAGDYDTGTNTRAVLAKIGEIDPDLSLALGDLSYGVPGAEQSWCDLVTQNVGAGFPFELISGNHESNGLNGNINDYAACLPNQLPGVVGTYGRQWYVDVPAKDPLVRFVMIAPALTFPDGSDVYRTGSSRYAWTATAIDGARSASIPWVVVSMHTPCLSLGEYACAPGADLLNLLLSKKVDLVLTGHEHLYQRTEQLALGAACTAVVPGVVDADCIVDTDASLLKGAGTVFVTVGTGGVPQRVVHSADAEVGYFAVASGLDTATWGPLDVQVTATTLSAAFQRASGGTFTDAFTIGSGAVQNASPTASFTTSCTALDCDVDASGSTDADGTIASYSWDFGDGSTGTGQTVSHRYATAGAYSGTLTVTDDDGATGSTARTVSVTSSPGVVLAADTFSRTTMNGFGTAVTGGAWRTSDNVANYAVSGGTGRITFATAGSGHDISLPGVSASSTDLTFSIATDKAMTGSGLSLAAGARRVAGVGEYQASVRMCSDGSVTLALMRIVGSTRTVVVPAAVLSGLTYSVGDRILVRVRATGTAPTTLQARVWKAGTPEPSTWQMFATDATSALQAPGSIGLNMYLSSSAVNAPLTVLVDDLVALRP